MASSTSILPFDEVLLQGALDGAIRARAMRDMGEDLNVNAIITKLEDTVPLLNESMQMFVNMIRNSPIGIEVLRLVDIVTLKLTLNGCMCVEMLHSFIEDAHHFQEQRVDYRARTANSPESERRDLERMIRANITEQQITIVRRMKPSIDALSTNRGTIMNHFGCFTL